ncbi:MAG: polysaccharide deacetylase family protein [Kyrpidia sp.]|nr:polysaccharide deacetylase family protein [Kyrpidia sp.]
MRKEYPFTHRYAAVLVFCTLLLLISPVAAAVFRQHERSLSMPPSLSTAQPVEQTTATPSSPVAPRHYRDRVLVLMYHHIDPREDPMTISPSRFSDQMDALQRGGYHVIGMDKLLDFAVDGEPVPDNAVVITFDDGYESFYRYAYPILKNHHFSATNFIIVKATDSPDPNALPHLTWAEMRQMREDGMRFGSHTYDLHHMAAVNASGLLQPALAHPIFLRGKGRVETEREYEERVRNDLALAQERLDAELGKQPRVLAFPYGAYNDTVVEIGRSLGIQLFFTVKEGFNRPKHTVLDRINAGTPTLTGDGLLDLLHRYDEPSPGVPASAGSDFVRAGPPM